MFLELMRSREFSGGGDAEVERESIFLPPGFFKLLCSLFFQRTDVHHPGGGERILRYGACTSSLYSRKSLLFDIFHRPKNV